MAVGQGWLSEVCQQTVTGSWKALTMKWVYIGRSRRTYEYVLYTLQRLFDSYFKVNFYKESNMKRQQSTQTGSNLSLSSMLFVSAALGLSLRLTIIDCLRYCFAADISFLYSSIITEFDGDS